MATFVNATLKYMPTNNFEKYIALRAKYSQFCYESFSYEKVEEDLRITFSFTANEITFNPTIVVPNRKFYTWDNISSEGMDLLVFNIGMIELISYWKSVCSPNLIIKPFSLTKEQIDFWKKLYYNGLSEFFYINGISVDSASFMDIECDSDRPMVKTKFSTDDSFIVPIGGGKDSVVTLELLRNAQKDIIPMIINPRGATLECAKKADFERLDFIEVRRRIDPKLLELNSNGYLNGHTPFSAMLAFHSLLLSAATGRKHIALSNESSANESTVPGTNVNHQYSKSLEFENDFRRYVSTYISEDFNYFSFLRPLTELQIAMLFAGNLQYFDVFKSCNVGSKQDIWCGNCPKCLFAYIILSPFINPEVLNRIFGKSMLNDISLKNYFDELVGVSPVKPFECVGTIEEVNVALSMTIKRFYSESNLPALLKSYNPKFVAMDLKVLENNHNLSDELLALLQKAVG